MTDEQIIKALEDAKEYGMTTCYDKDTVKFIDACIALINRQKAENERLKTELQVATQKRVNMFEIIEHYERGKADAKKELAKKKRRLIK